jgi:hypothetical protein
MHTVKGRIFKMYNVKRHFLRSHTVKGRILRMHSVKGCVLLFLITSLSISPTNCKEPNSVSLPILEFDDSFNVLR